MKIGNKEYGFRLTVGASVQIAKLCPDGDLTRIGDAIGKDYGHQAESIARIIVALNNGYAASEEFEGRTADRLTYDAVMSLSPASFSELSAEAFRCFGVDVKGEVEIEPTKKAEAAAEG